MTQIGGVIRVCCRENWLRLFGCGFLEAVYREALQIELNLLGIPQVREMGLKLSYRENPLRTAYRPDFV